MFLVYLEQSCRLQILQPLGRRFVSCCPQLARKGHVARWRLSTKLMTQPGISRASFTSAARPLFHQTVFALRSFKQNRSSQLPYAHLQTQSCHGSRHRQTLGEDSSLQEAFAPRSFPRQVWACLPDDVTDPGSQVSSQWWCNIWWKAFWGLSCSEGTWHALSGNWFKKEPFEPWTYPI